MLLLMEIPANFRHNGHKEDGDSVLGKDPFMGRFVRWQTIMYLSDGKHSVKILPMITPLCIVRYLHDQLSK